MLSDEGRDAIRESNQTRSRKCGKCGSLGTEVDELPALPQGGDDEEMRRAALDAEAAAVRLNEVIGHYWKEEE